MNKTSSTPFFRILFVLGWGSFAFFLPLFGIVYWENQNMEAVYASLSSSGPREFGVLMENTRLEKLGRTVHLYTYLVPDEIGKKHEVTEEVDEMTNRRMRVGDTITVRRQTWFSLGKPKVISRIVGNKAPIPSFHFLEELFLGGILYSLVLIGLGLYYRAFKAQAE
ncbi:hypothetical protein LEP1GSC050_0415 [Leptospira broomii serovar Hurstbridge str. 5399]|uniref:Uncharacterized protein n=1 Tax=Leptospira broomii serovar Hurstbridge str. 5399 TaxID=1049789 RepID=T0F6B3_9LEPT|nr:hypothetical protein [Leptospira broomii]EQA46635.1 hypothetical protein LEP1GSC050_0415 [Leptospira broomii serovar Hurstbridge str. 5399]